MGDGGAALGAEDAVHGVAGGALAGEGLGGSRDGQLVLGHHHHQRVRRPGLPLAVVAVVVPDDERVRVHRVLHGAAETVSGETHGSV